MIDLGNGNSIDKYGRINVILGKNGSGKSTLLRRMDALLAGHQACIRYITPERGGDLVYDGSIETNRANNPQWMPEQRRKNRYEYFRQSSVTEFRNLETAVLRSIESDPEIRKSDLSFDTEIRRINKVLDRVYIKRASSAGFSIVRKDSGAPANPADLSSGESELISLAVEILNFSYLSRQDEYKDKDNWLLLDEPDVHLHPDLQQRLMELLVSSIKEGNGRVAIATHSTAILSSLCNLTDDTRVGFKTYKTKALEFHVANNALKAILPMFGAHPLSNIFNRRPPLIVEGEDDERIWQAAVRSSEGRIALYPCIAGNVQSMNAYERAAMEIINSVYDDAVAFSLRDRDDEPSDIDDLGPVIRTRLNCRAAENLLVTDDVLERLGTNWGALRGNLEKWIADNPSHTRYADAVAFRDSSWDRRQADLKGLRMVIVGISGSTKPWEVAVGQAIADLPEGRFDGPNCLKEYLGLKVVEKLRLDS